MASPVTLAEAIALLDKFDEASDAPFNMRLAHDEQEARRFLENDFDVIARHWSGTKTDLDTLTRYLLGK